MKIKLTKKIDDYNYLLMFDLASKNTGVCLWDLHYNRPLYTTCLKVKGEEELPSAELLHILKNFFKYIISSFPISLKEILVVKEAMPTQLRGGSSTIQTFIAISRSHAILDTFLYEENIDTYDYTGIYPITWHNYFKKVCNLGKDDKVTKEAVNDYVKQQYSLIDDITLDETDAVFMCKTFIDIKWNADVQEGIREEKRHRKTLKAAHAINSCDKRIKALEGLKILDNLK